MKHQDRATVQHVNTVAKAAIYLRQSLDATGEQLAVARQREDCKRIAAERGWHVTAEYLDNSISASDQRKRRPAYDRMVKAYKAGEFTAIICWDLDRLTRQPRQLEDWIEAAQERGLLLVTANGEADLSVDSGRMFARIKAAVARQEIERKAERQRRSALQRAEDGRPPLGVRLTGYTPAGEKIEHEAGVVRQMFERFHAGDSLRGIAAWLNETGVPARHGKPWNPSAVRSILLNPRYCGRAIYRGEANGHHGKWPEIIDEAVFDAVGRTLADPRRRKQMGTDRKHLGSSLYLCGICGRPVYAHGSAPGVTRGTFGCRYRCPEGGHVLRSGPIVDDYVLEVVRARLARPDLAELLAAPESEDAREIAAEVKRLRARLAQTEADYDSDLIDGRRYRAKTDKIKALLTAAEAAQARLLEDSGIGSLLGSPNPVLVFDEAPLGMQRAVIAFFMTVRLLPAPRGVKGLNPDTVVIEWHHGVDPGQAAVSTQAG